MTVPIVLSLRFLRPLAPPSFFRAGRDSFYASMKLAKRARPMEFHSSPDLCHPCGAIFPKGGALHDLVVRFGAGATGASFGRDSETNVA